MKVRSDPNKTQRESNLQVFKNNLAADSLETNLAQIYKHPDTIICYYNHVQCIPKSFVLASSRVSVKCISFCAGNAYVHSVMDYYDGKDVK